MKYLKTFEDKIPRLRLGDYVVVNDKYIKMLTSLAFADLIESIKGKVGIIIKTFKPKKHVKYDVSYLFDEEYSFYKNELRLATPEEIEDYKMKENEIKYNL